MTKSSTEIGVPGKAKNSKQEKLFSDMSSTELLVSLSSKIVGMFFTAITLYINAIFCLQMAGRFSIYGIDNSYISLNLATILKSLAMGINVMLFMVSINTISYMLIIFKPKNNSVLKKIICAVFIIIIEMIIVSGAYFITITSSLFSTLNNIWIFFHDFFHILYTFFIILLLNGFGIYWAIHEISNQNKSIDKQEKGENLLRVFSQLANIPIIILFLFFLCFSFTIIANQSFASGVITEKSRTDYKAVLVPAASDPKGQQYIININEQGYQVYPVIFENRDIYILSQLFVVDGGIDFDVSYQKTIKKDDVETKKFTDIYKINTSIH